MGFPEKGCWEATVSIHADLEYDVTEMDCSSSTVLLFVVVHVNCAIDGDSYCHSADFVSLLAEGRPANSKDPKMP